MQEERNTAGDDGYFFIFVFKAKDAIITIENRVVIKNVINSSKPVLLFAVVFE